MKTIKLSHTTSAPSRPYRGGYLLPANTAVGGICCTLNTRYFDMALPKDILSLAHYPKTVVFIEYYPDG